MTRLCWAMCLMSAAGSSEICVDKDPMICQQLDPSACQDAWFAGNCCGSCSGAQNSATLCEKDIDISAIISGTYFLIPVRSVLHPEDLAAGWCAEHPELERRHCLAEASKAIGEVCTLVFRAPDSPSEAAAAPGCVMDDEICPELHRAYHAAVTSGCNDHLPPLHRLASQVRSVAEFGVANGDTSATLLSSWVPRLRSYDLWDWSNAVQSLRFWAESCFESCGVSNWTCTFGNAADSRTVTLDGGVDMLLIDSLHTYWLLHDELARHAPAVRQYVAMHDTTTFGYVDEVMNHPLEVAGDREQKNISQSYSGAKQGLWLAVEEFIEANAEWSLWFRMHSCNGFTVLRRSPLK